MLPPPPGPGKAFPRLVRHSLADQAADVLVEGIAAGYLKRGDRLVETRLAADFGISRIPLREALCVLESQGIVQAVPNRGRQVAQFDDAQIRHVCEVRLAVERLALNSCIPQFQNKPERLARLDALLERMRVNAEEGAEPRTINQCDIDFHTEIYEASGNSCLRTVWQALSRQVAIVFAVETFRRTDAAQNYHQHLKLRELIMAGDTGGLHVEIEDHIMTYLKDERN